MVNFCSQLINTFKTIFTPPAKSQDTFTRSANIVSQTEKNFSSTKELLRYAKERCMEGIHADEPHENALIIDLSQNKVLSEFKGLAKICPIDHDILEKSCGKVLIHGHPKNYPLSSTDINLLAKYHLHQVIAINPNGEFSLAEHPVRELSKKEKKVLTNFNCDLDDNMQLLQKETYKSGITDYLLKQYAPQMGMRYITNYSTFNV